MLCSCRVCSAASLKVDLLNMQKISPQGHPLHLFQSVSHLTVFLIVLYNSALQFRRCVTFNCPMFDVRIVERKNILYCIYSLRNIIFGWVLHVHPYTS